MNWSARRLYRCVCVCGGGPGVVGAAVIALAIALREQLEAFNGLDSFWFGFRTFLCKYKLGGSSLLGRYV